MKGSSSVHRASAMGGQREVRPRWRRRFCRQACAPRAGFRPSPQRHAVPSPRAPPTTQRKMLRPACLQIRSIAVLPCEDLGVSWVRWEMR